MNSRSTAKLSGGGDDVRVRSPANFTFRFVANINACISMHWFTDVLNDFSSKTDKWFTFFVAKL